MGKEIRSLEKNIEIESFMNKQIKDFEQICSEVRDSDNLGIIGALGLKLVEIREFKNKIELRNSER